MEPAEHASGLSALTESVHIVGEALIIYLSWQGDFNFADFFLFFNKIPFNIIANVIR